MNSVIVNGIKLYNFETRQQLIEYVEAEKKSLIAVNAEKILHANDQLRELINQNIGYSDGIGAVWALHKRGYNNAQKIPGCELWLDIVSNFYKTKSFYLVGAKEEVIQSTVTKLGTEFPGIRILGYRDGYLRTAQDVDDVKNFVTTHKPDVVFVAMGSPKQEQLMQELLQLHPAIYQGLGGSFDVYVGNVERAPDWWIRHKLEWAYRLVKQPSRIKRQIHLVRFAWLLMWNKL